MKKHKRVGRVKGRVGRGREDRRTKTGRQRSDAIRRTGSAFSEIGPDAPRASLGLAFGSNLRPPDYSTPISNHLPVPNIVTCASVTPCDIDPLVC